MPEFHLVDAPVSTEPGQRRAVRNSRPQPSRAISAGQVALAAAPDAPATRSAPRHHDRPHHSCLPGKPPPKSSMHRVRRVRHAVAAVAGGADLAARRSSEPDRGQEQEIALAPSPSSVAARRSALAVGAHLVGFGMHLHMRRGGRCGSGRPLAHLAYVLPLRDRLLGEPRAFPRMSAACAAQLTKTTDERSEATGRLGPPTSAANRPAAGRVFEALGRPFCCLTKILPPSAPFPLFTPRRPGSRVPGRPRLAHLPIEPIVARTAMHDRRGLMCVFGDM